MIANMTRPKLKISVVSDELGGGHYVVYDWNGVQTKDTSEEGRHVAEMMLETLTEHGRTSFNVYEFILARTKKPEGNA